MTSPELTITTITRPEVSALAGKIFAICRGQKLSTINEAFSVVQEKISIDAVVPEIEEAHSLKDQQ